MKKFTMFIIFIEVKNDIVKNSSECKEKYGFDEFRFFDVEDKMVHSYWFHEDSESKFLEVCSIGKGHYG